MSHTVSRASVQPLTQSHKLVVPGSLMPGPTPETPPQCPLGFSRTPPAAPTVVLSFPSITSCPLGLAGSTGSNQLSRKPPGWGCGDPRERVLPAHSLLRDPLPSLSSGRSPSPAGSPRLAPHQEEGKVRARPWGQSGGHVLTSAPALTREAPAMAPGPPRGGPRRPGSSRPALGLPSFCGLHVGRRGGDLQAPPQEAAVFGAIMAPSSRAWRYQHPSPPSSLSRSLFPPPEPGDGQG